MSTHDATPATESGMPRRGGLQIVRRRLDALTLDPANARKHGPRNLEAIRASLARFGQVEPVLVQKGTGRVIGGNGRIAVLREMGAVEADVVEVDVDDLNATALGITLNRTAELADWDEDVLGRLLGALADAPDFDAALTGFSSAEIARLRGAVAGASDPDQVPEPPKEPVTRRGDLWILGEHRLLCGDATDAADVRRVLAGARPFLMVSDPPYGILYRPAWRNDAGIAQTKRTGEVMNDDRADWTAAWQLFTGDVAYVWHAALHAGTVAANLHDAGFEIRAQVIWKKPRFAIGRGAYHWGHEPAWYAVRKGRPARWCGDRTQSTVWEVAAGDGTGTTVHGTQKPCEVMARPIRNHGEPGDLVFDPFLGSGTTLIAAVRERRRFAGLELDPRYVDVAVRRWEEYTGEQAERQRSSARSEA
ncbi:MAG: hypothetical protein HMLKMBBP_02111 [Planctomycetes bacterium]|nr:hypothetical protein [Planctomycetota bacterium]